MNIVEVKEELPQIKRGGGRGQSEETKQLVEKLKTGKVYKIVDVKVGSEYNALQQRIRSAADSIENAKGVKKTTRAKIRYDQESGVLHFQGVERKVNAK